MSDLFPASEAEQLRHFLSRIVEVTEIPADKRDDLNCLRIAALAARAFAKAALLVERAA